MKRFNTDGLLDNIADAVIHLRNIREDFPAAKKPSAYRRLIFRKTPQGQRQALIARVAAEESANLGVPITARQVQRWWEELDLGES